MDNFKLVIISLMILCAIGFKDSLDNKAIINGHEIISFDKNYEKLFSYDNSNKYNFFKIKNSLDKKLIIDSNQEKNEFIICFAKKKSKISNISSH